MHNQYFEILEQKKKFIAERMPVIGFSGKPNVTSKDYDVFPLFPVDLIQLTADVKTVYR